MCLCVPFYIIRINFHFFLIFSVFDTTVVRSHILTTHCLLLCLLYITSAAALEWNHLHNINFPGNITATQTTYYITCRTQRIGSITHSKNLNIISYSWLPGRIALVVVYDIQIEWIFIQFLFIIFVHYLIFWTCIQTSLTASPRTLAVYCV